MVNNISAKFKGRILLLGFGSIGQGVLPLLLKHIDLDKSKMLIIAADEKGRSIAEEYKISWKLCALNEENYRTILSKLLNEGDFLLNLSVNVSTVALIELCQNLNCFYLDTCIEPWSGRYLDPKISVSKRSNYNLREEALALKKIYKDGPTAMLAHGANPGLASHFVKKALLNIAADRENLQKIPQSQEEWSLLAKKLGVKVIHIAERDTQGTTMPRNKDEFVNTWSVEGFVNEGLQPAELGWGTHEKELPHNGHHHETGCRSAIYLNMPGASVRVRSWTPKEGPYHGFLIAHNEAISLSHYFSLYDQNELLLYRPTVHYAYHPCDDAILSLHELAGKNWTIPDSKRIILDEIETGIDELGVLLMGPDKGYWYGSVLSIEEAKKLAPHNNATGLQVTSAVLAGVIWILENPRKGIVEAEDADFERIMEIATPYLGKLEGHYTDWTPLEGRQKLFVEQLDHLDPWQFKNFQVV